MIMYKRKRWWIQLFETLGKHQIPPALWRGRKNCPSGKGFCKPLYLIMTFIYWVFTIKLLCFMLFERNILILREERESTFELNIPIWKSFARILLFVWETKTYCFVSIELVLNWEVLVGSSGKENNIILIKSWDLDSIC